MKPVVLFDGVCNFCSDAVNFIIRNDPDRKFMFAPLQSEPGQRMRARYSIPADIDTVVLVEDGAAHVYSTAALRIARGIGGVYSLLYAFIVVPKPIRDWFYKLFAKNRYRLFGKKQVCMMPTPDIRERFLT